MSLDGFIADGKGHTDFLVSDPTYDSAPLCASIDTVMMGRIFYEVRCGTECERYPRLHNYVVSRTLRPAEYPEVTVLRDDIERVIARLRRGTGKNIWLCGSGVLFGNLLAAGLVDTVELGVSPVLLGRLRQANADMRRLPATICSPRSHPSCDTAQWAPRARPR